MVKWLDEEMKIMLRSPLQLFFQRKEKWDKGVLCLAKLRSLKGWFLYCAFWPAIGGRICIFLDDSIRKVGCPFSFMLNISLVCLKDPT